jgi:hypothetical protein
MAFEDGNPICVGRVPYLTFEQIWPRCKLFI